MTRHRQAALVTFAQTIEGTRVDQLIDTFNLSGLDSLRDDRRIGDKCRVLSMKPIFAQDIPWQKTRVVVTRTSPKISARRPRSSSPAVRPSPTPGSLIIPSRCFSRG